MSGDLGEASAASGASASAGWRVRALGRAAAAAAAALIREAFAAQRVAADPPSSALRETAESVAARLAEGGGAAIEAEGDLIGLVSWAERDEALYLGRLAVRPCWRGRGAAHVLLAAAEAEARRRGLARLRLNVRLALEENRRLFAALGFIATNEAAHPGYARSTFAVMEKRLA
jgi:GNAT superfamily N-acetyltransferase